MPINRFIDDTNIVPQEVPEDVTPQPTPIVEPVINPEPLPINPSVDEQPIINPEDNQNNNESQLDTRALAYLNTIKEYEHNELLNKYNEVNKLIDDLSSKTPVYNYSRDASTGQIIIEPRKLKSDDKVLKDELIEHDIKPTDNLISGLINKSQQEIERISLEINVHSRLIKSEENPNLRKMYQNKLNVLKDELEYHKKRKYVLGRILSGD
jgi:hypothetical protein